MSSSLGWETNSSKPPFGVKGLGPVDVADGHQYELEQEIAGTYREHRVSRAIGSGHGITITTRGRGARVVLNRAASSSVC